MASRRHCRGGHVAGYLLSYAAPHSSWPRSSGLSLQAGSCRRKCFPSGDDKHLHDFLSARDNRRCIGAISCCSGQEFNRFIRTGCCSNSINDARCGLLIAFAGEVANRYNIVRFTPLFSGSGDWSCCAVVRDRGWHWKTQPSIFGHSLFTCSQHPTMVHWLSTAAEPVNRRLRLAIWTSRSESGLLAVKRPWLGCGQVAEFGLSQARKPARKVKFFRSRCLAGINVCPRLNPTEAQQVCGGERNLF